MALSLGQTGTADSIDEEYLTQNEPDSLVAVHMHLDAVDGIARDTIEGFAALPRRGAEVGGLLLGHVEPGRRPVVWIDRYQRLECRHHFGPQFVLDEDEHRHLEEAAESISRDGELAVVGFYRSHTRPGFQLEDADLEIVSRYFNDPADLILLIHPENMTATAARFFARDASGQMEPAGPDFPFRGRVSPPPRREPEPEPSDPAPSNAEGLDKVQPDTARTAFPERMRRIVPDFSPVPVLNERVPEREPENTGSGFWRKWLPLIAAVLLVGTALGFLLLSRPERHDAAAPAVLPTRPLGLYADPAGETWRVSWNPSASALKDAQGVHLFVRDGEDQNRIDLSPQDLQSGTYQYQPRSQDVTFRLEVTEAAGQIAAESFRLMKSAPPAPVAAVPPAALPAKLDVHPPRAIRRVPPVVPASIRPRIHGSIPIDVRVTIDARGRVTSAVPVGKHAAGLLSYLAERAVVAAKQWRFETGEPGGELIHFVFEK